MKLIKITAVWCPACIVMNLRWPKIINECRWLEAVDYDFDQDKDVIAKYNIGKEIPVFIFLDKEGNEFLRLDGEIDRRDFIKLLNEHKDK